MDKAPNKRSAFSCSDVARAANAPGTTADALAPSTCMVRICTRSGSFAACRVAPKLRRPSPKSSSKRRACQVP
eukprot:991421-Prorocentrum_minimum.AAC.1